MGRFAVLLVALLVSCTELVGPGECERFFLRTKAQWSKETYTIGAATCKLILTEEIDGVPQYTWECSVCNDPAPEQVQPPDPA